MRRVQRDGCRPRTKPAAWAVLIGGAMGAVGAAATSCDPTHPPSVRAASSAAFAAVSTDATGASNGPSGDPDSTRAAYACAPPLVTPMPGEPDATELGAARLETTSCAAVFDQAVEAELEEMRAAIDREYEGWQRQEESCLRGEKVHARAETWGLMPSGIGEGGGFGSGHGRLGGRPSARAPTVRVGAVEAAGSASETNNQVAGVDEADIVKHDGRYVYFAVNGALRIMEALHPRLVSVTPLGGEARMLFVKDDRAVVYVADGQPPGAGRPRCTYGYNCLFAGDGTRTRIVVYDIAHRAHPTAVRTLKLSGSLLAARRIDQAVHTVVSDPDPTAGRHDYPTVPPDLGSCDGTGFETAWKRFRQLELENEKRIRTAFEPPTLEERGRMTQLCDSALRTRIEDGRAFTSVISFDLDADDVPAHTVTLTSRPGAVYASPSALYLSVPHFKRQANDDWYPFYGALDEISDVHQFAIGADPTQTRYVGSGVVPGRVLNQFAMDEWSGCLRIATTRGRAPNPEASSTVSILAAAPGGNLVRVGATEPIAPSEDIRSVRFDAERGYVVTFKKTDPLFVLDLDDPRAPQLLGELEIPGFSTYLHRIDRNHLLSIGFDTDDHGRFAYFAGVLLQLFDVTEPTNPKLLHREVIGTRGSSSAAATDHLAFNYWPERGLLGIPMTICEGGNDGRYGGRMTFSGLLVYDVSIDSGFSRRGGVDHGHAGATCTSWWTQADSAVKRSLFLDDLVYSIALDRVKVQKLDALGRDVTTVALR